MGAEWKWDAERRKKKIHSSTGKSDDFLSLLPAIYVKALVYSSVLYAVFCIVFCGCFRDEHRVKLRRKKYLKFLSGFSFSCISFCTGLWSGLVWIYFVPVDFMWVMLWMGNWRLPCTLNSQIFTNSHRTNQNVNRHEFWFPFFISSLLNSVFFLFSSIYLRFCLALACVVYIYQCSEDNLFACMPILCEFRCVLYAYLFINCKIFWMPQTKCMFAKIGSDLFHYYYDCYNFREKKQKQKHWYTLLESTWSASEHPKRKI